MSALDHAGLRPVFARARAAGRWKWAGIFIVITIPLPITLFVLNRTDNSTSVSFDQTAPEIVNNNYYWPPPETFSTPEAAHPSASPDTRHQALTAQDGERRSIIVKDPTPEPAAQEQEEIESQQPKPLEPGVWHTIPLRPDDGESSSIALRTYNDGSAIAVGCRGNAMIANPVSPTIGDRWIVAMQLDNENLWRETWIPAANGGLATVDRSQLGQLLWETNASTLSIQIKGDEAPAEVAPTRIVLDVQGAKEAVETIATHCWFNH